MLSLVLLYVEGQLECQKINHTARTIFSCLLWGPNLSLFLFISGLEKSFLSQKQRLRYYNWLGKSDNWSNLRDRGMGNIRHLDIDNRIENKNKNKLPANKGHLILFLVLNWAFGRPISLSLHLCSSFLPLFTFFSSSAQCCSLSMYGFAFSLDIQLQ